MSVRDAYTPRCCVPSGHTGSAPAAVSQGYIAEIDNVGYDSGVLGLLSEAVNVALQSA